jgi:hypothetical protein
MGRWNQDQYRDGPVKRIDSDDAHLHIQPMQVAGLKGAISPSGL